MAWRTTLLGIVAHPLRHILPHNPFKGGAESAIVSETTLAGQLLDGKDTLAGNCLFIEADEMFYTQILNIGIVSYTLTGEIVG